ncbi:MAG: hypothetical protein ACK4GM_09920 [Tabrizicola sp.]
MKIPFAIVATLGALVLTGCVETTMTEPVATTGGNLTGTTATNCRAAIAREMNRNISDVAIFDVLESEAGNVAQASVAGAEAPWICRTDRNGRVSQVMYSGQG